MATQISDRRFGVEFECHICNWTGRDYAGRFKRLFPRWSYDYDGSLGEYGKEIKTPPLIGEAGLKEMERGLEFLHDVGAWIESDCGTHVHHEVDDLSKRDIVRLVRSWTANQGNINKLVDESRIENNWCMPWDVYKLNRFERKFAEYGYVESDKYLTLNVSTEYGTVEIRQKEGTLDYDDIRSWILFGQSFIDGVAKRKRAIPEVQEDYFIDRIVKVPRKDKKLLKEKIAMRNKINNNQLRFPAHV